MSCSVCVIVGEVIPSNTDATTDNTEKGDQEKENKDGHDDDDEDCTFYRLRGIVVHSGQASGGHYYSFISYR